MLCPIPEDSSYDLRVRATLSVATPPPHQRFAVLMQPDLWKKDTDAERCDAFDCDRTFHFLNPFERRHHCRRCGGVFCASCSSKTFPLLDTSTMPFVIPPAHIPMPLLVASSPTRKLVQSRVCDDCYDFLQGETTCRQSHRRQRTESIASTSSSELPSTVPELSSSPASYDDSESVQSVRSSTPRNRGLTRSDSWTAPAERRPSLASVPEPVIARRAASNPATPTRSASASFSKEDEKDKRVLETYPLMVHSNACKSSQRAVWAPKPHSICIDSPLFRSTNAGKRQQGEIVDAEDRERVEAFNRYSLKRDGEFQFRVPTDRMPKQQPEEVRRNFTDWSTF